MAEDKKKAPAQQEEQSFEELLGQAFETVAHDTKNVPHVMAGFNEWFDKQAASGHMNRQTAEHIMDVVKTMQRFAERLAMDATLKTAQYM